MTSLYLAGTYAEIRNGGGRLNGLLVSERGTFDSDIPSRRQRQERLVDTIVPVARRERERE